MAPGRVAKVLAINEGLDDSVFADASGEFFDRSFVEGSPWLIWIRRDLIERDVHQ